MNVSGANATSRSRVGANQNIQVYARVRPINTRERCIRSTEVVDVISPREIVARHTAESKLSKKFTFDRTFGPESKQVDVYNTVVAPLIEEVLCGYNCTVFAYGQTGTGKTHTMIGTEAAELKSSWEDDSEIGIIPRALSHLFDELRLMELEFSMRISYLELYNEELCDLLSSDDSIKIRIFDDSTKKGSVIIQGLEEIPVHSKDDVYKLLEKGKERRKTATTLMNAQSSRSHTVFSILVHIRENGLDGEEMLKIGKLNLVDLAGSENVTKAGNEKGIRVRETVNINQSLLTLGRVITALVERTPHIPYRESKLTRLLQESLGGRTKTSIIATISPGHKDIEETLSTLEYAHRAKNIQNKPEVNQKLTKKTVLKEYTEEIDKLKRDLLAARDKNGIYLAVETYNEITLKMDSQNRELNEKMLLLKALKDELQNKEKIFNEVSLNLVEKTEELKRTEQSLTQTKGALRETKKILNTTKRRYKEKKVLLESHIKTETELTNQACKILEVADTATDETQQLHSTIERRKDVDAKIQTACERFTDRMKENFELMDGNLSNLQDQHKNFAGILLDEFSKTHEVHDKLLKNANQNIQNVNDLCTNSFSATIQLSDEFSKTLTTLSDEHKAELQKLFQAFQNMALEYKRQVQENLNDLECNNAMQKQNINKMQENIIHIVEQDKKELSNHAATLEEIFQQSMTCLKDNKNELDKIIQEIDKERTLDLKQQTVINDFVQLMQTIKDERSTCINSIVKLKKNAEKSNIESIVHLEKGIAQSIAFKQKREASDDALQIAFKKQATDSLITVQENVTKCETLQNLVKDFSVENKKQIDAFDVEIQKQHKLLHENIASREAALKKQCSEDKSKLTTTINAIETSIQDDVKQLKKSVHLERQYVSSMENQLTEYHRVYAEQMRNCDNDVVNFKNSELQTYKATGTTPSKRDYSYPRVLTSTSPHNIIIKRIRQENEWSDLDTTATIDELSENEEDEVEDNQTRPDITDSEIILNSTPIDVTNVTQKRGCGNNSVRIANTLKPPQQQQFSGSFTNKRTSPLRTSPKSNKENIS